MQILFTIVKSFLSRTNVQFQHAAQQSMFSTLQNPAIKQNFLRPLNNPIFNQTCGFKVKGHVKRRCKSCYIVVRNERIYNICPKLPRHKQMSMKPKPHNTWVLTHATQGKIRAW